MHGDELRYVQEAIETNWVSTVNENINEAERLTAEKTGRKYMVGLSCGTAALRLAIKLAGKILYGQPKPRHGTLEGHKLRNPHTTFFPLI